MGLYNPSGANINIRGISEVMDGVLDDWYNATVEILKPDIEGGNFDRKTNVKTRNPEVIWSGKARIQAVRWPNVATTRQEAIAIRTVVFHLPLSADVGGQIIHEGWRVRVLDGGMSPQFTNGLFVVTAAINSSYAWDRRIETVQDMGVSVAR